MHSEPKAPELITRENADSLRKGDVVLLTCQSYPACSCNWCNTLAYVTHAKVRDISAEGCDYFGLKIIFSEVPTKLLISHLGQIKVERIGHMEVPPNES